MSENKNYKIIKTTESNVLFTIHPISNPMLTRLIHLTDNHKVQILPLDWALGVFADDGVYSLYRNKKFTFDDNDSIVKEAFKAGVYFDETLDFVPATEDYTNKIFKILSEGTRSEIMKAITDDADAVQNVAITRKADLKQGVIQMLENALHIQLTVDGE